jgi:hypothetical protein
VESWSTACWSPLGRFARRFLDSARNSWTCAAAIQTSLLLLSRGCNSQWTSASTNSSGTAGTVLRSIQRAVILTAASCFKGVSSTQYHPRLYRLLSWPHSMNHSNEFHRNWELSCSKIKKKKKIAL